MTASPTVSVLISTFNRSRLLRRAIESVLKQDFDDFEIIIIDDCSQDDTASVVESIRDSRIRYIRNETNIGSQQGDRALIRRLVYDLARGSYFVYLCDDDYWLFPNLLSRQVAAFKQHDNLVMAIGGQLSHFLTDAGANFGVPEGQTLTFTPDNIGSYFNLSTLTTATPYLSFMQADGSGSPLFPKALMSSSEFLESFAADPTTRNLIVGATLYSRERFIRSGALRTTEGSRWQAGYELLMGPACYGRAAYFNEPSIITEIRPSNASFRRTQVEHYLDSIKSVEIAFQVPLQDEKLRPQWSFLRRVRNSTIRNLSRLYLVNTMVILRDGSLTLCSDENIHDPVRLKHVIPVLVRNRTLPSLSLSRIGLWIEKEIRFGHNALKN